MIRRKLDIAVISDLHLGTYGCHSVELLKYLKSIKPKNLILNGDIFDMWQFKKKHFPKEHIDIVYEIIKLSQTGSKIYYLTGNHDDLLRHFSDTNFGNIRLADKLIMVMSGKKYWFFHGDIFDVSTQNAKWLAKLGGKGYDILIQINRLVNKVALTFGKKPMSFSQKVKENVKKAVKYINDFEQTAVDLAIDNGCDYVVCGHIHQACIKEVMHSNKHKSVIYMNSGDWVESLTSLEYNDGQWRLYKHDYETESAHDSSKNESFSDVKELAEYTLFVN